MSEQSDNGQVLILKLSEQLKERDQEIATAKERLVLQTNTIQYLSAVIWAMAMEQNDRTIKIAMPSIHRGQNPQNTLDIYKDESESCVVIKANAPSSE